MQDPHATEEVEMIFAATGLADVLESERFKQFLDHVPVAIAVSELHPSETITYCNLEFERMTGRLAADIQGKAWKVLPGIGATDDDDTNLVMLYSMTRNMWGGSELRMEASQLRLMPGQMLLTVTMACRCFVWLHWH